MTYQLDEDQWDEEALPLDWCIAPTQQDEHGICRNDTTRVDSFRLPWCTEHEHRSDFLAWGKAHSWPALQGEGYAVGQGSLFWGVAATQGTEDMLWSLMAAIELLKDKIA